MTKEQFGFKTHVSKQKKSKRMYMRFREFSEDLKIVLISLKLEGRMTLKTSDFSILFISLEVYLKKLLVCFYG